MTVGLSPDCLLEIRGVSVNYGGIQALQQVDLSVKPGECVTLIGANGAGKSTTLKVISRLLALRQGEIFYNGQNLQRYRPDQLVGMGLAHCPEGRRVLARQTVRDNLLLGAYCRQDYTQIQADLHTQFQTFPRLGERQQQLAGTLSGGEQQMLALARALMSRPQLLLLDEPSLGLAPAIVQEIFGIIQQLLDTGVTILLVEQNANLALQIAHRGYVLEAGRVILTGPTVDLLADERVKQAYLG
jgi:branched-chain amino acid transport system ATP-binding protein